MLYSVKQLRQIEKTASSHRRDVTLMCAAGKLAADYALQLIEQHAASPNSRILIVAGPGNNGGDAFETAIPLSLTDHPIDLLHLPPKATEFDASTDRDIAFKKAKARPNINWLSADAQFNDATPSYALVIDGLFGIGFLKQVLSPSLQKQIEQINAMACPVLALDIPSGLNADTGDVASIAIEATHTLTFIGDKPGLHTCDGNDVAGVVEVATLGIEPSLLPDSTMTLNSPDLFPIMRQARRHNSNKGSNGTVELIGGATGMCGALILASRAALYAGAGRIIAGFIDNPPAYDPVRPEIMCRPAIHLMKNPASIVVIGPGSGNSIASFDLLSHALLGTNWLVIDADALNLMSQQPALMALCNGRDKATTLLTPHPLEAARLLGCSVEAIQSDRISAAKKLARRYSSVAILKGSGTVIADPSGNVVINPTGNAGLASGGTGDVLAGICGALAAQHHSLWQAALAATYFHGAAADSLVRQGVGPVGLCASELLVEIRKFLNP